MSLEFGSSRKKSGSIDGQWLRENETREFREGPFVEKYPYNSVRYSNKGKKEFLETLIISQKNLATSLMEEMEKNLEIMQDYKAEYDSGRLEYDEVVEIIEKYNERQIQLTEHIRLFLEYLRKLNNDYRDKLEYEAPVTRMVNESLATENNSKEQQETQNHHY